MKRCPKCGIEKPRSEFGRDQRTKTGLLCYCRDCHNLRCRIWGKENRTAKAAMASRYRTARPEHYLWAAAKIRAERWGLPFTIVPADVVIPLVCPVFGTLLARSKRGQLANSPSLDRFVPELGYVPGNIAVISHRANALKFNASLEEHRALVLWMEKVTGKGPTRRRDVLDGWSRLSGCSISAVPF